jgi:hypothetical protein
LLVKANPTRIDSFLDNPNPLIRNVGAQPYPAHNAFICTQLLVGGRERILAYPESSGTVCQSIAQVSVSSCSSGEVVLVMWSEEHTNYQVTYTNILPCCQTTSLPPQPPDLPRGLRAPLPAHGLRPGPGAGHSRHCQEEADHRWTETRGIFHSPPCNLHSQLLLLSAEVVDKEYCQAKKPENRFKVTLPKNT